MHSYLIVGKSVKKRSGKINELTKTLESKVLVFALNKISDARELNSFLKLKIDKPTTILIQNIDQTTKEALNAFLKNLEEPQEKISYILTAETIYNLLPTIISRCQVINVNSETIGDPKIKLFAKKFINLSESKKLSLVDPIKDREEAKDFIKKIIQGAHLLLLTEKSGHLKLCRILKIAGQTFSNLKANGNVKLQLTNFSLQIT